MSRLTRGSLPSHFAYLGRSAEPGWIPQNHPQEWTRQAVPAVHRVSWNQIRGPFPSSSQWVILWALLSFSQDLHFQSHSPREFSTWNVISYQLDFDLSGMALLFNVLIILLLFHFLFHFLYIRLYTIALESFEYIKLKWNTWSYWHKNILPRTDPQRWECSPLLRQACRILWVRHRKLRPMRGELELKTLISYYFIDYK